MPDVTPIKPKWRPSIAMVVVGVCLVLVSLPFVTLLAMRLTSNQFIRETEQTLIQQGAIYAEVYANAFASLPGPVIGVPLSEKQQKHWSTGLRPVPAALNVHKDPILEVRPDGAPIAEPLDPRYVSIREDLIRVARGARQTNLSGIAFLDQTGRLLNSDGAPSLGELTEIRAALDGEVGRALRARGDEFERHPFASISRDTGYRVFVAFPVISQDRVIGVVYLSRTPLNLGKFLVRERNSLLIMLGVMFLAACLTGWLLVRLISRPVIELRDQSIEVSEGRSNTYSPLPHYGFRELASLGESFEKMTRSLTQRSTEIATHTSHVTHELKSPVTAILGAAELLQSESISEVDRKRLEENIAAEAQRMNKLLDQLRELARVRATQIGDPCRLEEILPDLPGLYIITNGDPQAKLPLSVEHGQIIMSHLAQNALAHNATRLQIIWDGARLSVIDNGDGIPPSNRARLTEPFFTTRRDTGGTGMGLAICAAVMENYKATIASLPHEGGAFLQINFRQ